MNGVICDGFVAQRFIETNTTTKVPTNTRGLIAESVQGSSLSLEGVHHIHGSHRLSLGVLRVRDGVTHHSVQERLQHRTRLIVDQTADTLHAASSGETTNGGLGDTQNVVAHHLAMSLRSSLSKSLSSLSTSRHLICCDKEIVREAGFE